MQTKTITTCALALAVLGSGAAVHAERGDRGHEFRLFGGARDTIDPQNSTNDVVLFDTTATTVSGAVRKINKRTQVDQLTNQVQLKFFFVNRTCGGGSPRIQLGIDKDGDGKFDANAFGYLGDKAFGGGCAAGQWVFEDMTDGAPKWDLSQLGGPMTATWAQMVAFLKTTFPNHQIVNGVLVDDSCSFFAAGCGQVFFDNVTIGNRTIEDHRDTKGNEANDDD